MSCPETIWFCEAVAGFEITASPGESVAIGSGQCGTEEVREGRTEGLGLQVEVELGILVRPDPKLVREERRGARGPRDRAGRG